MLLRTTSRTVDSDLEAGLLQRSGCSSAPKQSQTVAAISRHLPGLGTHWDSDQWRRALPILPLISHFAVLLRAAQADRRLADRLPPPAVRSAAHHQIFLKVLAAATLGAVPLPAPPASRSRRSTHVVAPQLVAHMCLSAEALWCVVASVLPLDRSLVCRRVCVAARPVVPADAFDVLHRLRRRRLRFLPACMTWLGAPLWCPSPHDDGGPLG